jgi:hypothetical protein
MKTVISAAAHGRRDKHYAERVPARGEVHVVFSRGDVGVLREYYAPRYRNLPSSTPLCCSRLAPRSNARQQHP